MPKMGIEVIRIGEKNKVSLSNKMVRKKGHDTKIVSYHSHFFFIESRSSDLSVMQKLAPKWLSSKGHRSSSTLLGHLP